MNNDPSSKVIVESLWRLQKVILDTLDFNQVVQKIVDSLLTELGYLRLGYRIIVLTLADPKRNVLKRISLSQTTEAERALAASPIPFRHIEIPLMYEDNLLIRAYKEKKSYITHYWPDIFTPVLSSEEALKNQRAAGIKTSMLYPIIVKDTPIGVLIFSLIKDEKEVSEDEKDLIGGFTDIVGLAIQNAKLYTSLEDASEKLKKANERLKEVDKLKDEFVSLASHELRTPMTVIKSYVWLLLQGQVGILNEKQKVYLERTYSSTERLINLVNEMLNVSRIESGRFVVDIKTTNIVSLVKEVIAEMEPRAQDLGISLILKEAQKDLPMVLADPERIKEVLINLIGNSLKFTPKEGKISISFSFHDGVVITSVTDTGSGIKKEDIPNLFQKFGVLGKHYLQKQNAQGTGLGLYISKSIIELHGGKIWVDSSGENKGSTFSFSLKTAKG